MPVARSPHSGKSMSFLLAGLAVAALSVTANAQRRVATAGTTAMEQAAEAYGIPEAYRPLQTAAESRASKKALRPGEEKLNGMLRQRLRLLENEGMAGGGMSVLAGKYSTPEVPIDEQGRMLVELQVRDEAPFTSGLLESMGGSLKEIARGHGFLTAWVPVDQLLSLAARPEVKIVRHVELPKTDLGSRQSEGDAIHNADDARACFGVDGTGITVGVISDGIDNLASSQGLGDLPAVGTPGSTGSGDEGTAMLEIVADLAPGASLNFAGGGGGTTAMINAITALAGVSGMDVITDDLANPQEPLFEDGPIAQAKQTVWNAGIFYTCSAGNRANQHYQGNFSGLGARSFGGNDYENVHDFGGGDYRLNITLNNGNNDLYLQWAEPFGSADIDIDVFITDLSGNILGSSTGGQNGGDDPAETISFNSSGGNGYIIIDEVDGDYDNVNVFLDIRSFNIQFDEFVVPQGSINGASRQNELYAAGAANASASTTVTSYSSKGPINHFFPASLTRMKPDGTAIDGVTVTGAGCFGCGNSCPPTPPVCTFFGTSAATPHVAALAALLLDWDGTLTPNQVKTTLNSTATDIDVPGVDNNAGAGLLDIKAAICSLDNTAPTIGGSINGGSVDTNCSITVSFSATITDDGCVSANNVVYGVTVPGGNASVGTVSASVVVNGHTTTVDGTAVIHDLTSCPAVVRLTVDATDDCGNAATTFTTNANVVDDTKPVVTCPSDITVECSSHCGVPKDDPQLTAFFAGFTADDNCTVASDGDDAPDCFDLGTTTVNYTATDECGNSMSCSADVTVQDTTPPDITVALNRDTLWPPNHKLSEITAEVTVTDICDPHPTFVLYSITSNEPDNGTGDGDTPDDIQADIGTPDVDFLLRSERAGGGEGRKYTITYRAMDMSGNTRDSTVCVYVPHDMSGHANAASGFTSTGAALNPDQSSFTIVIPSKPNFDARTISGWGAAIGNSIDAARPKKFIYRDRTSDGRPDLELTFDTAATLAIRAQSTKKDPIGLHWWTADGQGWLVDDIFKLGQPLMDLAAGENSQGDGASSDFGTGFELPDPDASTTGDGQPGFDTSGRLVTTESGPVTIEVFDVLGRRVRTLNSGDLGAGTHDVTWDGRDDSGQSASVGLYFVRVRTTEGVFTRKIRLEK